MKNFKELLVFLHLVLMSNTLLASNYFLSSSGNDGYSGTSEFTPWRTLSKLDSIQFYPGDTIHFKKGDKWLGRFKITESGSETNPICFTSYGDGDFPQLSNPNWDYTWDGGVIRITGSYIVIENLHFIDGAAHPYEENKAAHENVYEMGAINLTKQSSYCKVQYCEFEDYPIGVQSQGQHNKIFQNYFHDCNKGMCLPFWGPIAIFSGGKHDEISYNYVINYKGGGFGGFDGGAIEIDHFMWGDGHIGYGADSILIHHNISIENAGFLEPEALNDTKGNNYIEIYNNFSDDYKWFISDDDLNFSTVKNNTSLRILPLQKSLEFVILIQGVGNKVLNNLFIVANGLTTYISEKEAKDVMDRYPYYVYQGSLLDRKHNIYYCHDQSVPDPIGRPKDETEDVLTSWRKLSPPIYDSSGAVLRPQPDINGIIRAWVPTDKKFEFESFTIILPQSKNTEDALQKSK